MHVLFLFVICCVCVVYTMSVHSKADQQRTVNNNSDLSIGETVKENFKIDNDVINKQQSTSEQCENNCTTEKEIVEDRALKQHGNRKKKKKQQDLMSRILPMMVIPFMIQTAMIPMALTALKFMLLKSAIIGKLAILLSLLNALRRSQNNGGVYSHNVNIGEDTKKLHQEHYGYYGAPEYGAWINR